MSQNHVEQMLEQENINRTLHFIKALIESEKNAVDTKEEDLIAYRREMYENTSHDAQDFNKLAETVQYLNPLVMQTMDYQATVKRLELYEKMYQNPYFARIDFNTEEWGNETIYIGIGNLENEETFENYIYDWRAPIASMFYRYEVGKASYNAPVGEIEGEIKLKRQYEIKESKLRYFFDSNVNIMDNILRDTLSKNTSTQMKTIVETIQREQDLVIRDVDSDLLMVQGVAGSGKTSIALHRAAYLMYQGLNSSLKSNNILLISPNNLFAQYISNVLPELGEDNIKTMTFEKIFFKNYSDNTDFMKRTSMLEDIFTATPEKRKLLQDNLRFKNSPTFLEIINRLIDYYEKKLIDFTDIMYGGKTIAQKQLLKARLLNSSSRSLPLQVRLNHIETMIRDRIKNMRPKRMKKLEEFISERPELMFDVKSVARLLNTKQVSVTMKQVRNFTKIDYLQLYKKLFTEKNLFAKLSVGLDLPDGISEIINYTKHELDSNQIGYNDAMVLMLLKLRMDANHENLEIRQVIVDEAQDYSLVHFEILARLFPSSKYTVLGDINQMLVEMEKGNIYDSIRKTLNKKKNHMVVLSKSFRCTYEIAMFSRQFAVQKLEIEQLERHGEVPKIFSEKTEEKLVDELVRCVGSWQKEGYETIGIICKSASQAWALYKKMAHKHDISIFSSDETVQLNGVVIIPIYLSKGLEFDAVAIYEVNEKNYNLQDDRNLLYVATTRALHRLSLFHTGKLTDLVEDTKL